MFHVPANAGSQIGSFFLGRHKRLQRSVKLLPISKHVHPDSLWLSRNCGQMLEFPSVSKSEEQHDLNSTGFRLFGNPERKRKKTLFSYLDEFLIKSVNSKVGSKCRRRVPVGTFLRRGCNHHVGLRLQNTHLLRFRRSVCSDKTLCVQTNSFLRVKP